MKAKANPFLILSAACIAIGIPTAAAATWTGDIDASWATAGNWIGTPPDNIIPTTVVYDANSTANLTQILDASYTLSGITLTSPAAAVVVNNGTGTNTLTLGSGGIDLSAATQNLTLNVNTTANATQAWNVASGRTLLRSGGTTTFGDGTTTTLSGAGIVNLGGSNHTLTGAGNLVINGASLYNDLQPGSASTGRSGTTTLNSGIIRITTSISIFGTGGINLNGGAIGSGNANARTISSNVTIGGNVDIGGATGLSTGGIIFSGPIAGTAGTTITHKISGVTQFTGTNTFAGLIDIQAGDIVLNSLGSENGEPSVNMSTGRFILAEPFSGQTATIGNLSGTGGTITGAFGGGAGRTLQINQTTNGVFDGNILDASGGRIINLIKTGAATLSLGNSANSFTGSTTISAGTLRIAGAGRLNNGSYAAAITNNATLHFDSTANQTLSGTITGNGDLLKSNTGFLTISGNASGFTGDTTVSGGRLALNGSIGGDVTIEDGASIAGSGTSTGTLTMEEGSTFAIAGGIAGLATLFEEVVIGDQVFIEFTSPPDFGETYDVVEYDAGGITGFDNLVPLARGTLDNDEENSVVTFTAGASGELTWNTGDGVWDRFGILENWTGDDTVFYQGDDVIFGDIASDTVITLDGQLAPGEVLVEHSENTYTFAGTGGLSGNIFFDKFGAGTLQIANPNPNMTGSTLIDEGVFRFIDGGTWGTGDFINDGSIEVDQSTNLTLAGAISGTGSLVKNGTGTLRLGGGSSYSGATTFNAGNLQAGANNAFGTGTLTVNSTGTISSDSGTTRTLSNNLVLNTNPNFGDGVNGGQLVFDGTVDLQGATRTLTSVLGTQGARFSGVISNGGITKAGAGRVTLANDTNSFTGATTIDEGILATTTGALATSASVHVAGTTDGGLALGSNGTTTINNLTGTSEGRIRSDFNIGTDGDRVLSVNQSTDGEFAGAITGGGAARPIFLIKEGTATLTLSGSNTYIGTTTVNVGTLKIGDAGVLGGGSYGGAITNSATLHFDSTANQILSGAISGAGTLLKSNTGTLILTTNNSYEGDITVNAGTLQIGNNTTAGFIGNDATVTNNGALVWFRSNETNVGNNISGTGTLTKLGTAALNLNGNSSYTGATTVSAGTLRVNGSLGNTAVTVEEDAILAGNGNIGGSVTIEFGATHALAVAATPGAQVTRTIGGTLTLDSGNILSLTAATEPAPGTYTLATATDGINGSLGTITLAPEITGNVSISGNSIILTVGSDPYDTWAAANGLDGSPGKEAGFDDDPDGDGVANGLEWILGGNPLDGQSGTLVTTTATAAGGLTLAFTRNEDSIGEATLTVEYNTDLGAAWESVTIGANSSSEANGVEITIDTDATPDAVSVNIPASNAPGGKLFARLKATQP